ncbi:CobW family GTP-binding protein [Paenibacillus massiliensis]|uniref:CobW family GTP-binding protein n=1 Tax=Paenibacillus massiliensis TaxID=225917 RepID=UPI0004726965|nr:GTP-binding protein [Paenibacillus massiliensis]
MNKTPVIIISGFLGSGKTTLLLKLLRTLRASKIKPAILMNELGKADVDGRIITEAEQDLPLERLFDGCICCSKKSEIAGSLQSLLALAPDVILVELTGVANPEEVIDTMFEPTLHHKITLHKIITVLDAEHVLEYSSIFSSDRELVHTLRRQLEIADIVLVNKQDLVPHAQLSKVERLIRKHNGQANIFHTIHGEFKQGVVTEGLVPKDLQASRPSGSSGSNKSSFSGTSGTSGTSNTPTKSMASSTSPAISTSSAFKVVSTHRHDSRDSTRSGRQVQTSFSRIQTIMVPISKQTPISLQKLAKWLKSKGHRVLRAKGYVPLEHSSPPSLVQFAGRHLRQEQTSYQGDYYLVIIGFELDENSLLSEWKTSVLG